MCVCVCVHKNSIFYISIYKLYKIIKNFRLIEIVNDYSNICQKLYLFTSIGLMSRVFTNGLGDWGSTPGQVIPKTQKMVFNGTLLILSIIRYGFDQTRE